MFGVIVHFDDRTEQYIKELWRELSVAEISKYAEEVVDRRPHLTIASYQNVDVDSFMKHMEENYRDANSFGITFNILGTFIKSGTLFLTPTMNKELTEFHQNHHKTFHVFNDHPESLYSPGKWVPHCTIANRLSPDKLTEAFNFCTTKLKEIQARITEVALIKVKREEGKAASAPTLYSIKLK